MPTPPTLSKPSPDFVNKRKSKTEVSRQETEIPLPRPPGENRAVATVRVIRATNLPAADKDGKSDPFLALHAGIIKVKTKVQKNTLNPVWEETFELRVADPADPILVRVKDYDKFGSNDVLGEAAFRLDKYEENVKAPLSIGLKGGEAGTVELEVTWRYATETEIKKDETILAKAEHAARVAKASVKEVRPRHSQPGDSSPISVATPGTLPPHPRQTMRCGVLPTALAAGLPTQPLCPCVSLHVAPHHVPAFFTQVRSSVAASAQHVATAALDVASEVGSIVKPTARASKAKIEMATPEGRWWTAAGGWPHVVENGRMTAPRRLMAPALEGAVRPPTEYMWSLVGYLKIEVLEAIDLPAQSMQIGKIDPYVCVIFEDFAARTSTIPNTSDPAWAGDSTHRAFVFPVTCPYAVAYVAVHDDDAGKDDAIGRVVLEPGKMRAGTIYDVRMPLQYRELKKHVHSGGVLRLRYSFTVTSPRTRLLKYLGALSPPSYAVVFRDKNTFYESAFAYRGKYGGVGYKSTVFKSHTQELQDVGKEIVSALRHFLFWKTPSLSVFALLLWQLVVTFPFMLLPSLLALMPLATLVHAANFGEKRAAIERRPGVCEMLLMLVLNRAEKPLTVDPVVHTATDIDSESDSDDESEDEGNPMLSDSGATVVKAALKSRLGVGDAKKRRRHSLQYELDKMRVAVEEEVEAEIQGARMSAEARREAQEQQEAAAGSSLNPLAGVLGPVQVLLGQLLLVTRVLRRLGSWHDPFATLAVCLALTLVAVALSLVCWLLGWLLGLVPWSEVFGYLDRGLGVLIFGPHMIWVGRKVEKSEAQFAKESEQFALASDDARTEILKEHRARIVTEVRTRRAKELQVLEEDGDDEVAGEKLGPHALVVQPVPASAGKLKFACKPDIYESRAYPTPAKGAAPAAAAPAASEKRGGYTRLESLDEGQKEGPEIAM